MDQAVEAAPAGTGRSVENGRGDRHHLDGGLLGREHLDPVRDGDRISRQCSR